MRRLVCAAASAAVVLLAPGVAHASMPLTNSSEIQTFQARYGLSQTGVIDGPTAACAWHHSCPPLPATQTSAPSDGAICHNGILADDAGQHCADGIYDRLYGSGGSAAPAQSTAPSPTSSSSTPSYSGGASSTMERIAQCESGGNPTTNTGNGFYGKYQFTDATWHAMGGSGHASDASEAEQDMRATKLYAGGAGAGNWPVCSRR